jgi:hypothetical protein
MFEGACHCGVLAIRFETTHAASELPVRQCGCTFCVKHRPRYTSDPSGHVTIRIADDAAVSRYRFGLRLADFLICRHCGVFVAAYEPGRAVMNLAVLDSAADFVAKPIQFTAYDSEDVALRTARRVKSWTPATLEIGQTSSSR